MPSTSASPPPSLPSSRATLSDLLAFLKEASDSLNRASGLTEAHTRVANLLESLARERFGEDDLRRAALVERVRPASAQESRALRSEALNLYNAAHRGSSGSSSVLRLRAIACDCLSSAGTDADVSDQQALADVLDSIRCDFSSGIALSLMSNTPDNDLAIKCICRGVSLLNERPEDLLSLAATAYDGQVHETGATSMGFLGALIALCALLERVVLSDRLHTAEVVAGHLIQSIRKQSRLLRVANASHQRSFRNAFTKVCATLGEKLTSCMQQTTLDLQKLLVQDLEYLSSSCIGERTMNRIRLCIFMAKSGDTAGAIALAENAGTLEAQDESPLPASWFGYSQAKVEICLALLRDEVRAAGGEDRVKQATENVFVAFNDALDQAQVSVAISKRPVGDGEKAKSLQPIENAETKRIILNLAYCVCSSTHSFEMSYGRLLSRAASLEYPYFSSHALAHAYVNYVDSQSRNKALEAIETLDELRQSAASNPYLGTLLHAMWKDVCKAKGEKSWSQVQYLARIAADLTRSNSLDWYSNLHMKAIQAWGLATLQVDLPDSEGNSENEVATLSRIESEISSCLAGMPSSYSPGLLKSATLLLYRARARRAHLQKDASLAEELLTKLRAKELEASDLTKLAKDTADACAHRLSTTILLTARDYVIEAKAPKSQIVHLTDLLIHARLSELTQSEEDDDELAKCSEVVRADVRTLIATKSDFAEEDANASLAKLGEWLCELALGMAICRARAAFAEAAGEILAVTTETSPGKSHRMKMEACRTLLLNAMQLFPAEAEESSAMISVSASKARELLEELDASNDARGGSMYLLSLVLMGASKTASKDDHMSHDKRTGEIISGLLNSTEFPSQDRDFLLQLGRLARAFAMPRTLQSFALRALQGELSTTEPRSELALDAALLLLDGAESEEEVLEWADQIEFVRSKLAPRNGLKRALALERAAVALWRAQGPTEARASAAEAEKKADRETSASGSHDPRADLALVWMQEAMELDETVCERRETELRGLRAVVAVP